VVLQSRWDGAAEAFEIIQRGPEMLTSQFNTSYGLVLSLLATKRFVHAA
jgi:superfamily II RNA helicase